MNWILDNAILNQILNKSFFVKIQTLNWIRLGIAHPYLPFWKKDQCCMIDTPLIWIPSSQLRLYFPGVNFFLWQRWTFWSEAAFPILSKPPSLKAVNVYWVWFGKIALLCFQFGFQILDCCKFRLYLSFIPHICPFMYTATLLRPVKSTPKSA